MQGFGEWRALPTGLAASVQGAVSWLALDAQLAIVASSEGGARAPAGASYLLVYGAPGASIAITVA